jgi:hypothetical protein
MKIRRDVRARRIDFDTQIGYALSAAPPTQTVTTAKPLGRPERQRRSGRLSANSDIPKADFDRLRHDVHSTVVEYVRCPRHRVDVPRSCGGHGPEPAVNVAQAYARYAAAMAARTAPAPDFRRNEQIARWRDDLLHLALADAASTAFRFSR